MTETYYLIGFVACFLWGLFLIWRNSKIIKNFKAASELTNSSMKGLIENINRLEEENKALRRLTASQTSETKLSKDHDLESYKDLSAGEYGRFNSDDLDEVSHMLTDDELRKFGG